MNERLHVYASTQPAIDWFMMSGSIGVTIPSCSYRERACLQLTHMVRVRVKAENHSIESFHLGASRPLHFNHSPKLSYVTQSQSSSKYEPDYVS
jgi:hypothetical protein